MADLEFSAPTAATSLDELRPALDAALGEISGGFLQEHWEGDVLRLSGSGLSGTVTLNGGHLVLRGTLRPPASFFRSMFEPQVVAALRKVAASANPAGPGAGPAG